MRIVFALLEYDEASAAKGPEGYLESRPLHRGLAAPLVAAGHDVEVVLHFPRDAELLADGIRFRFVAPGAGARDAGSAGQAGRQDALPLRARRPRDRRHCSDASGGGALSRHHAVDQPGAFSPPARRRGSRGPASRQAAPPGTAIDAEATAIRAGARRSHSLHQRGAGGSLRVGRRARRYDSSRDGRRDLDVAPPTVARRGPPPQRPGGRSDLRLGGSFAPSQGSDDHVARIREDCGTLAGLPALFLLSDRRAPARAARLPRRATRGRAAGDVSRAHPA